MTDGDAPGVVWPLKDAASAHAWNVSVAYERARAKVLAREARALHDAEDERYPLWVYRRVLAACEEREFYWRVALTDRDRLLVYGALAAGPKTFRGIVAGLGGRLGQRQARRALQSLVSRGMVRAEVRQVTTARGWRVFAVVPSDNRITVPVIPSREEDV